jgi:hypothetical protein
VAARVGNTVLGGRISEGTWLLRDLVLEIGLGPAASLMDMDRDQIGHWTRNGLPKHLWQVVRVLCDEHLGKAERISQDTAYCERTSFSLSLTKVG